MKRDELNKMLGPESMAMLEADPVGKRIIEKSANDDSLECQRTTTEPGGEPAPQINEPCENGRGLSERLKQAVVRQRGITLSKMDVRFLADQLFMKPSAVCTVEENDDLRRQLQELEADNQQLRYEAEGYLKAEKVYISTNQARIEAERRVAQLEEALRKLAKGNRAPGVLEIARAALRGGDKI